MAYKDKADAYKYNNTYNKESYDRINVTVPQGQRNVIKAHADSCGESVNGFIRRAIREAMDRDQANQTPPQGNMAGEE